MEIMTLNQLSELLEKKYHDVKFGKPATLKDLQKIEKKFNFSFDGKLKEILLICDGISELMKNPRTNKPIEISKILYSVNDIIEQTSLIIKTYKISDFIAISDDDSGNFFLIKNNDEKIYIFNTIDDTTEPYAENIIKFLTN